MSSVRAKHKLCQHNQNNSQFAMGYVRVFVQEASRKEDRNSLLKTISGGLNPNPFDKFCKSPRDVYD